MKIFCFFLFFSATAFSQITVTQSDFWAVGDTIARFADTMTTHMPGNKGANQVWNFPTATQHENPVTKVMSPSATPYGSSFSNSNQAMSNNDSSYLFFNASSSNIIAKGFAGDVAFNGAVFSVNVSFNPDLLVNNLPVAYGSAFTDTYGYDFEVDGSSFSVDKIRIKHFGTVYDTIDGWGTVTTPVGTYDCLRQKVTEHKVDSVWVRLLPPPLGSYSLYSAKKDTTDSYSWLAKNGKLAVAELTFDTLDNPKKFTWTSVPPLSVAVIEEKSEEILIYPNPTDDGKFQISNFKFQKIEIYNVLGEKVFTSTFTSTSTLIELSNFPKGIYLMKIWSEEGIFLKKIVLQ